MEMSIQQYNSKFINSIDNIHTYYLTSCKPMTITNSQSGNKAKESENYQIVSHHAHNENQLMSFNQKVVFTLTPVGVFPGLVVVVLPKTSGEFPGLVVVVLPKLNFNFLTAGFNIWREHIRVSSTLIMAPALSNSPQ